LPVLPQASARRLAIELAAAALACLFLNWARRGLSIGLMSSSSSRW
jgi:hypothetical protein